MEITIVPSQNCSEDEWVRPQALCRPSRCNLALFLLPMCLPQPAHGVSLSLSFFGDCLMLSVLMFFLLSVIPRASGIGEHSTGFILGYK